MRCEGDLVLVYYQDQPAVFARIELIESDIKKGWYQVTLLLLTIPTEMVTWILRDTYIDGAPFTMGGRSMRLEEVKRTSVKREPEDKGLSKRNKDPHKSGKVIPFKKP